MMPVGFRRLFKGTGFPGKLCCFLSVFPGVRTFVESVKKAFELRCFFGAEVVASDLTGVGKAQEFFPFKNHKLSELSLEWGF